MATTEKVKKRRIQSLVSQIKSKRKKNASRFFGKLKDGIDGLTFQKKIRDEWA